LKRWLGRAVAFGIAIGISFACAGASPPPSAAGTHGRADELDVEEAVFRYQLDRDPVSPKPRMADFVLLSLDELHSPAPELVARFADQSPPVDSVSELRIDAQRHIRHKTRPGKGMILMAKTIRRLGEHRFEVDGEIRWGSRGASGTRYLVQRRGSSWVVVSYSMSWIT